MADAATLLHLIAMRRRAIGLDSSGAELDGADLTKLDADDADFSDAMLADALLPSGRFVRCRFVGARLARSDWTNATLRICRLDRARAEGARFDAARLEDCSAVAADLSAASLRRAHLTDTTFARAVLRGACMDGAEGESVEFRGADLSRASLVGARLDDADFRGADLRGADLSRGRFRSADFRGALLDGAAFDGADCSGASYDAGADPQGSAEDRRPRRDAASAAMVRDLLAQLPAVLGRRDGASADLVAALQRASLTLASEARRDPLEWQSWADALIAETSKQQPTDLRAVLTALLQAPIGSRDGREATGPDAATALVDRLHSTIEALEGAEAPPAEWQPILKTLMGMSAGDRPVDLKTLLDQLASFASRRSDGRTEGGS